MTAIDTNKIRRHFVVKILGIFVTAVLLFGSPSFTCAFSSPRPMIVFQTRRNMALAARSRHRSSSSSSSITATKDAPPTLPSRNAKHRKRREGGGGGVTTSSSTPRTQQQVAHHVAHQYLHGSGGVLRQTRHHHQKSSQRVVDNNNGDNNHDSYQQEQASHFRMLDRHPCLLLNADYQPMSSLPLSLWNWQDAVKAVFLGKVTVVDVYDDIKIRAANLEVALPSVIALNEYVPQFSKRPAFTKRNVFLRDEYRCQYCTDRFYTRDLSLDHVVPRCQGGLLTWENAVTCCNKCNCKKGSLHVHQLKSVGMKLSRQPFVPTQFQLAAIASKMLPQQVHPTWEPYLSIRSESKWKDDDVDYDL